MRNNLDTQYQGLLMDIITHGVEKSDRTGTGTISVFGRQIRHRMSEGYPLLTTKKMAFRTMVTELLWFLRGDTNIKYLVDNGCNIWNGDAYKAYLDKETTPGIPPHDFVLSKNEFIEKIKTDDEFAKKWGELGPIYGKQWRSWQDRDHLYIDQIKNLVRDLKENPDSRRLMVNSWNVGELGKMTLPPCHYGFQCYTTEMEEEERQEQWAIIIDKDKSFTQNMSHEKMDSVKAPRRKLSLMWNQRSVDTFLGLPFNIASYGLLLEIIAKEVNMVPWELVGNLGDVHLYNDHIQQAKEQIRREPFDLPRILFKDHLKDFDSIIDILRVKDFILDGYESHPAIQAPLSN
jgi:thymidylate synthase